MNSHNTFYLFAAMFFCLLMACSSGQEEATEQAAVVNTEFRSIPLSLNAPDTKLADLIESVEIVKLEETYESLLSFINAVHEVGDSYVFSSEDGIYTFSNEGEYVEKFSRFGEGPEEHDNIEDLWMEGDTAVIHDTKRYIKRYLLDGTFISAEKLENNADHIMPFEDGYLMDMGFRPVNDTLKFGLIKADKDGVFEQGYLPFDKFPGFSIKTSTPTVQTVGGMVLIQKTLSDSVYLYADGQVKPLIHYDFGDDWLLSDTELSGNFFTEVQQSEKTWMIMGELGPQLTVLNAQVGMGSSPRFLMDRSNGKTIKIDVQIDPEEKFSFAICKWRGPKEAILSLESLQVAPLIDQLDESQYSFRAGTTLEEIESSENRALLVVKWKDSAEW